MDDDVAVKILSKHIMKFFKLSSVYFAEGADKEKLAAWLAKKFIEEGWFKVTSEMTRETLHHLAMNSKYLGGKGEQDKIYDVLPKGSKIAILKMGGRVQ